MAASDRLAGVLSETTDARAPQPAGELRWVLGCVGAGAEAVYVLVHVRSGLLTGVPHVWGPPREQIPRQLAVCTQLCPQAAGRIEEAVVFDRQAVLLPAPVRRRIEAGLDALEESAYLEQRLTRLSALNQLALLPEMAETPEQSWQRTLERIAAASEPPSWWTWLRSCVPGSG